MIAEKILNGLPLDDVFVFDVHGHYGPSPGVFLLDCYADGMLATMDKLGINSICVSSTEGLYNNVEAGNDIVEKVAKENPSRIYGYALPSPHYEYDLSKYFYPGSGILGIKIIATSQNSEIRNKNYIPALELADKLSLPVLFHAWDAGEVNQAVELATRFKNAKVILAHAGVTSLTAKLAAIEGVKKCENVFVDTAVSIAYEGAIEWIVSKVGVDRVLYGSDLPYFDCRQTFGKIALSKLSETDKIKIYGENAKKVFDLK